MAKGITFYKINLMLSMIIFGSIGVFRRYIPLSSGLLASLRGIVGAVFIFAILLITKKKLNITSIKSNLFYLIISGVLIGFNWILLFEAYRFTSVSTATLCYYMAPIFVIFLSPVFLKQKSSFFELICGVIAFIGMFFVSGNANEVTNGSNNLKGILFGLGAALFYAFIILLNQKLTTIEAFDKTIIQLASAGLILIPYTLIFETNSNFSPSISSIFLVILVCVLHTGVAYFLYFNSMKMLKANTIAFYSYIDPIVALILSSLILKEIMSVNEIIGAVLILGATFLNEIKPLHKNRI